MRTNLYWAGDSTVKHNFIDTYPQTGIGQVMNLYLKKEVIVKNHAENGRSTKSFLEEGRLKEIEAQIGRGDFLFIQFGHNDEKEDVERHTNPFGSYQDNLLVFVEAAQKKGAYPVLITPVYRRHFDEDKTLKEQVHLDYPQAMLALAKRIEVPCIDLCEKSRRLLMEAGDRKSKSWFMNFTKGLYENYPDGLEDNTHLRYEGAVRLAGLVAEGLRELGGVYKELLV